VDDRVRIALVRLVDLLSWLNISSLIADLGGISTRRASDVNGLLDGSVGRLLDNDLGCHETSIFSHLPAPTDANDDNYDERNSRNDTSADTDDERDLVTLTAVPPCRGGIGVST
jgi:hypothetical protein